MARSIDRIESGGEAAAIDGGVGEVSNRGRCAARVGRRGICIPLSYSSISMIPKPEVSRLTHTVLCRESDEECKSRTRELLLDDWEVILVAE